VTKLSLSGSCAIPYIIKRKNIYLNFYMSIGYQ
jgi:hypothetical protein